jgi:uncharacterized protein YidB (DUF937 family)
MGLLNQIIGGALASRAASGNSSPLMSALMMLLAARAGGTGAVVGGLGGLAERFQRNGHGDVMNSWIGTGANRPIQPNQLAEALGPDDIDELQRQTGMPRQDLLSELSHMLPGVVDKLTPHGRMPDRDEMARW